MAVVEKLEVNEKGVINMMQEERHDSFRSDAARTAPIGDAA